MALNAPRNVDYDFRVFEHEGIVYLYDESAREYPCTAAPHIYAEPLYAQDGSDIDGAEPGLWRVAFRDKTPAMDGSAPVDFVDKAIDEHEAWAEAREEAHANHRL